MRGLSIRHPWAWAILHAGKRIENRDWYCDYRGPVLIHASKLRQTKHKAPMDFTVEWRLVHGILRKVGLDKDSLPPVSYRSLLAESGGIIGRARIVDCILPNGGKVGGGRHPLAADPWYAGNFGIVLEDVQALPFTAYKGSLGLWKVNAKVLETIERLAHGRQGEGNAQNA
jgi:hypothetical protein